MGTPDTLALLTFRLTDTGVLWARRHGFPLKRIAGGAGRSYSFTTGVTHLARAERLIGMGLVSQLHLRCDLRAEGRPAMMLIAAGAVRASLRGAAPSPPVGSGTRDRMRVDGDAELLLGMVSESCGANEVEPREPANACALLVGEIATAAERAHLCELERRDVARTGRHLAAPRWFALPHPERLRLVERSQTAHRALQMVVIIEGEVAHLGRRSVVIEIEHFGRIAAHGDPRICTREGSRLGEAAGGFELRSLSGCAGWDAIDRPLAQIYLSSLETALEGVGGSVTARFAFQLSGGYSLERIAITLPAARSGSESAPRGGD